MQPKDDAWTNKSEEFACTKCSGTIWNLIFLQDNKLYGDCGSCENQDLLFDLGMCR